MDSCDADKSGQPPKDSQNEQSNSTAQDSKDGISVVGGNPKVESGVKKLAIESQGNGQSPASGRLVYVRRKLEADTSKASTNNGTVSPAAKEPTTTTTKSSVAPAELSPKGPSSNRFDWEERYHHLQMLLNKLNESDQTDHIQMLWSLSSAELSKHAVELEKRSIQLSLEEAREMQRVAALNVLGRSVNSTTNDGE